MTEQSDKPFESSDSLQRKQLERLHVFSRSVLLIDQFMLANDQFIEQLPMSSDESDETHRALADAAHRYGGEVISVECGDWGIFRDPMNSLLILAPDPVPLPTDAESDRSIDLDPDSLPWDAYFEREVVLGGRERRQPSGRVFIDTRCLVIVDAAVVLRPDVIGEYKERWDRGDSKGARDFLRKKGAVVRYGFNRDGDELGIFWLDELRCWALWPDVVEAVPAD